MITFLLVQFSVNDFDADGQNISNDVSRGDITCLKLRLFNWSFRKLLSENIVRSHRLTMFLHKITKVNIFDLLYAHLQAQNTHELRYIHQHTSNFIEWTILHCYLTCMNSLLFNNVAHMFIPHDIKKHSFICFHSVFRYRHWMIFYLI